jgi:hypothetical protein
MLKTIGNSDGATITYPKDIEKDMTAGLPPIIEPDIAKYKKLPKNMSPRDMIVKKLEESEKRQMSVKAKLLDGLIQDPRMMITTCEKQNPFKDYYP